MIARFGILNAIFIYFIFLTKLSGQSNEGQGFYKFNAGIYNAKGFVLQHNEGVAHLAYGRPASRELYFNWNSDGSEQWQHRYGLPEKGVSLAVIDTDMEETGKIYYSMAYMQFFLLKLKIVSLTFRLGSGLTYAPKRYDRDKNNLNVMLSSPLSLNMQGRLGLQFNLTEQIHLNSTVSLSHASNGAWSLPNSGINIVSSEIGLGYYFKQEVYSNTLEERDLNKKISYMGLFSLAARDPDLSISKRYPFATVRFMADYQITRVNRIGFGLDFLFNTSLKKTIEEKLGNKNAQDYKRIAVVVGHELIISNFSIITQIGRHVYRDFRLDGFPDFYQRYGLKYYLHDEIHISMLLKAFKGRADNIAFGIGWRR